MSYAVLLEHNGPISTLTLNRAQAFNAINSALAAEFLQAIEAVGQRAQTRVLVIQGSGKAFMAGGDVPQFREAPDTVVLELIEPMNQAIELITQLSIPVLASVNGVVAGAGISLMLACDLAVAVDSCKINFAYTKLGASCDLGLSWLLPRVVGLRKAMEIALLSDPITAQEAKALGLINQCVSAENLAVATAELAERLASSAPIAIAELKKLLQQSFANTLSQQLAEEKSSFARCLQSDDFHQAVAGFLDKHPVSFRGV